MPPARPSATKSRQASLAQAQVLDVAELLEAGRHPRVHRPLAQQVRAEGVDGAGEQPLDARRAPSRSRRRSSSPAFASRSRVLERLLESAAQLRRRLPREGDGGHPVHAEGAALDAGRHPHRQAVRLARAGAGLDQEVAAEVRDDAIAHRLVARASGRGLLMVALSLRYGASASLPVVHLGLAARSRAARVTGRLELAPLAGALLGGRRERAAADHVRQVAQHRDQLLASRAP